MSDKFRLRNVAWNGRRVLAFVRTLGRRATFLRPFSLKGLDGVQAAGTYHVETREGRMGFLPFIREACSSTWIRIGRGAGLSGEIQLIKIDPDDLSRALLLDVAPKSDPSRIGDGAAPIAARPAAQI